MKPFACAARSALAAFALVCASPLACAADRSAAMAILVTPLGAATGALTWMALEWVKFGKPSVLGIVTGMVAGLGTITPASAG